VLQVGVRNAYARDWLSSRLTEKSSTLAAKAFSQTVRVEFVVAV
jgi:hypothetical protein